jgi:hypothetical protein
MKITMMIFALTLMALAPATTSFPPRVANPSDYKEENRGEMREPCGVRELASTTSASLPCWSYYLNAPTAINMETAKGIIELLKSKGEIRDRTSCKALVNDTKLLAEQVIRYRVSEMAAMGFGFMHGEIGECACDSVIQCDSNGPVVLYSDANFSGDCQAFGEGIHRADRGHFKNLKPDDATSFTVAPGYKVRLCDSENDIDGVPPCEPMNGDGFGQGAHHLEWKDKGGVADIVSFVKVWRVNPSPTPPSTVVTPTPTPTPNTTAPGVPKRKGKTRRP